MNGKTMLILSVGTFVYFGFLFLNAYWFKVNFIWLSVGQEWMTLPLMGLQLVLLFLAVKSFMKEGFSIRSYAVWSTGILLLSI